MMPFRILFILALARNGGPAPYLTYFPFLPTCFHYASFPKPSLSPPQRCSTPHACWVPSPTLPQGAKCKHTKGPMVHC